MAFSWVCSPRFLVFLVLLSAVPIGIIISLELAKATTHVYHYHSTGWFRECGKWDEQNGRFIVAFFEGGIGEIRVRGVEGDVFQEIPVVKDVDLAGNASLGILIDPPRNRLLAVHADALGNRYAALAAYHLSTWKRLFLTHLSGPSKLYSYSSLYYQLSINIMENSPNIFKVLHGSKDIYIC